MGAASSGQYLESGRAGENNAALSSAQLGTRLYVPPDPTTVALIDFV